MPRDSLNDLDRHAYDIVIIGGGISGASAAQYLAAAGYSVLLAEKGDYASAATSRSGRLLHCGLRYLGPAYSLMEFVREPRKLVMAVSAARRSIRASTEFIRTSPERQRPMRIYTTIDRSMPYSGFHVDLGARFLQLLNLNRQRLNYRRYSPQKARELPYMEWLRDTADVTSVIGIDDHQFNWPERICIDAVMDARRLGANTRNYTLATGIGRTPDGKWRITLQDMLSPNQTAEVDGTVVLNMAGAWIDKVNASANRPEVPRKITAVKGVHILVQLPPEYRGQGFMGLNRNKDGLTCMPWGDMHFVGPTETVYDGDLDDVRPEETDVQELLDEITYLMPGISLGRDDVRQAWAGIRPITYHPDMPRGDRMAFSKLHDLSKDGMENVFTLTWAAIMFHRSASAEIVRAVRRKLAPSGPARPMSHAGVLRQRQPAPPVVEGYDAVTLDDLVHSAKNEQAQGLVDLLFRRLALGWFVSVPPESVARAADAVAGPLGWSEDRKEAEIRAYHDYVPRYHLDDSKTPWRAA